MYGWHKVYDLKVLHNAAVFYSNQTSYRCSTNYAKHLCISVLHSNFKLQPSDGIFHWLRIRIHHYSASLWQPILCLYCRMYRAGLPALPSQYQWFPTVSLAGLALQYGASIIGIASAHIISSQIFDRKPGYSIRSKEIRRIGEQILVFQAIK